MSLLAQFAFLQALGWALLHSLWQMGICWLFYHLITVNGRKFSARQRYNIGFALTISGTIAFFLTFGFLATTGTNGGLFKAWHISSSFDQVYTIVLKYANTALPLFSICYMLAVIALMVRLYRQYHYSNRLFTTGIKKANPELRLYLDNTIRVLGVKKKVRLAISELINTPLTIGFWKPIILLPVAAISHLTVQQVEAIVLHELNHIKQNDYLFNILIASLDVLLFFNPFSRWLTNTLVKEREHNCDDVVLQFKYAPCDYAEALYLLEKNRSIQTPLLALSAVGSSQKILLTRIQRILFQKPSRESFNFRLLGFLAVLLAFVLTEFVTPLKLFAPLKDTASFPQSNLGTVPLYREQAITTIWTETNRTSASRKHAPIETNVSEGEIAEDPIVSEPVSVEEFPVAFVSEYSTLATSYSNNAASFSSAIAEGNNYTLYPGSSSGTGMSEAAASTPYVPSNSFVFNAYEDTANPKQPIMSEAELKAREDLIKALSAIDQIDWEKFEKELGTVKGELLKFRLQLKKALQEIDWKKMEQELQAKYKSADIELKAKQAYLSQLYLSKELKEKELAKKVETERQKLIILDRLKQNHLTEKQELERSQKAVKTKKIVVI